MSFFISFWTPTYLFKEMKSLQRKDKAEDVAEDMAEDVVEDVAEDVDEAGVKLQEVQVEGQDVSKPTSA